MRSSIVLLTFFSGIKAFSCEGAMKSFKVECAAQDRYQRLLTEFRNRSLAPQDLKGYQVAHALGKSIFESSKNEFSKINETDLSQNKKWKIWKNGQNLRGVIFTRLQLKRKFPY